MNDKIVCLDIVDYEMDVDYVLRTYYLLNPDINKLENLILCANNRFEEDDLGNEFCIELNENGIDVIDKYIEDNFQTIQVCEKRIIW